MKSLSFLPIGNWIFRGIGSGRGLSEGEPSAERVVGGRVDSGAEELAVGVATDEGVVFLLEEIGGVELELDAGAAKPLGKRVRQPRSASASRRRLAVERIEHLRSHPSPSGAGLVGIG